MSKPMVLFSKSSNPLVKFSLRSSLIRLAHQLLSWRTRRMILLSSIYGVVLDIKKPDIEHSNRLSSVLNLAKDPRALELPVAIKSVIWYLTDENKVTVAKRQLCLKDLGRPDLTEEECNVLANHVVEQIPGVLRYAKTSQMVYDVKCLSVYLRSLA